MVNSANVASVYLVAILALSTAMMMSFITVSWYALRWVFFSSREASAKRMSTMYRGPMADSYGQGNDPGQSTSHCTRSGLCTCSLTRGGRYPMSSPGRPAVGSPPFGASNSLTQLLCGYLIEVLHDRISWTMVLNKFSRGRFAGPIYASSYNNAGKPVQDE